MLSIVRFIMSVVADWGSVRVGLFLSDYSDYTDCTVLMGDATLPADLFLPADPTLDS